MEWQTPWLTPQHSEVRAVPPRDPLRVQLRKPCAKCYEFLHENPAGCAAGKISDATTSLQAFASPKG